MAENGKPTVASEWLTGCAGCHMSLLDIDERIVDTRATFPDRRYPATAKVGLYRVVGAGRGFR